MGDNARKHPASLGDSRKFGTKKRKMLVSIGTTDGDRNHLEAKREVGALIRVNYKASKSKYPEQW